jgi:hypothetical protein
MAHASGILSRAFRVPLPSCDVVPNPPAGVSLQDNRIDAPAPLQKKYVLRLRAGSYLHSYSDFGVFVVPNLDRAKLFSIRPDLVADLFCAEILTVLVDADGSGVRRTLLDRARSNAVRGVVGASHSAAAPWIALKEGSNEKEERDEEQEAKEGKHQAPGNGEASNGHSGRCPDPSVVHKPELASDTKAETSAEKADGEGQTRPSFLITRPIGRRAQIEEGKRVFFDFVSTFLGVEITGVQNGFNIIPDQFLFKNKFGSTLMLPINLMLLTREDAVAVVQNKLRISEEKFEKTQAANA